tara:strand:+ start:1280 stop:1468 length:189 start_codon:yes stop_codon:yes gene_type:complete
MATNYTVSIMKNPGNPGYTSAGNAHEKIEITASDANSARSLVEAQYRSGGYKVVGVVVSNRR